MLVKITEGVLQDHGGWVPLRSRLVTDQDLTLAGVASGIPEPVLKDVHHCPYQVPEWFMERNVLTHAHLVDKAKETDASTSDNAPRTRSSPDQSEPKIDPDVLGALQDLLNGIFMWLPSSSDSAQSLTLQRSKGVTREYVDKIICRLAVLMNARLLVLDMDDLEDLSWEFDHQRDPYASLPTMGTIQDLESETDYGYRHVDFDSDAESNEASLSESYFTADGKYAQLSRGAGVPAVLSILKAVTFKEEAGYCGSGDHGRGLGSQTTRPLLILYHRRDESADEDHPEAKYVKALRSSIRAFYKGEDKVAFLVSTEYSEPDNKPQPGMEVCDCSSCREARAEWKRENLSSGLIQLGQPPRNGLAVKISRTDDQSAEPELSECPCPWTRSLKRVLRYLLSRETGVAELTTPHSCWTIEEIIKDERNESNWLWSSQDTWNAIYQITGRVETESALTRATIDTVLQRIARSKSKKRVTVPEGSAENRDSEIEIESISKIESVRSQCDTMERVLLDCIIEPNDVSSSYDDIIMDEQTKKLVQQMVSISEMNIEASSRALLEALRLKGALFYGPPGTGKTHLCRAIAKQAKSTMLAISPADVTSKWVGDSENLIKAAFSLAKKLRPCVIFIDEVDALFFRRSGDERSWERNMTTQFLQEMDGLVSDSPLVIAATNRPQDLDDAFLRRLPQKIMFGLPVEEDRAKILRTLLHQDDLDGSVAIEDIASKTAGYSGSDLKSLCGQAALAWAADQSVSETPSARLLLTMDHFAAALGRTKPAASSTLGLTKPAVSSTRSSSSSFTIHKRFP